MGPGERNIRQELRRQAAQVPIPTDMWENISGQLDADRVRTRRPQYLTMKSSQWKPALALVAAVGMLWLTVAPAGSRPEPQAATGGTQVRPSFVGVHDTLPVRIYRHAGYNTERSQPEELATSDGPPARGFRGITAR